MCHGTVPILLQASAEAKPAETQVPQRLSSTLKCKSSHSSFPERLRQVSRIMFVMPRPALARRGNRSKAPSQAPAVPPAPAPAAEEAKPAESQAPTALTLALTYPVSNRILFLEGGVHVAYIPLPAF